MTEESDQISTRPSGAAARCGAALIAIALAIPMPEASAEVSEYRPGGMAPQEIDRALTERPHEVGDCAELWLDGPMDEGQSSTRTIARASRILSHSATARAIMSDVARSRSRGRALHVCLDRDTDLLAYYFSSLHVIGLNARLSEGGQVAYLAHEIGHVPQHPRFSDNRYYPPSDLILLRRVREATAEATAIRIAWELREAGYPEAWAEKAAGPYADMVRAFAEVIARQDGMPGLLQATRAAFDRWFAVPWRRNVYDRMTVEHLRRIAGDRLGLVPHRRKVHLAFLLDIGRLGEENFLSGTEGPAINDPFYTGGVSTENQTALKEVLERAKVATKTPADGNSIDSAVY
jgi:hypothetical protein